MRRTRSWTLAAFCALACAAGGMHAEERVEPGLSPERPYHDRFGAATTRWRERGGFDWLEITTSGDGRPSWVEPVAAIEPPLDLEGRFPRLWIRVEPLEQLAGLELRLASGPVDFFAFPVPLFADLEFGVLLPGTWTPLTWSFGAARSEGTPARGALSRLGVFLRDRGEGPVRVDLAALSSEAQSDRGVLSLTFDDGWADHLEVAAPALAAHGFAGTAYVIPEALGRPGYLTRGQAHALADRYGWDVSAHLVTPLPELAPDALEPALLGVLRFLRVQGFGASAAHLAYPLGKQEPRRVLPLVREHFATARLAGGGAETLPPADPHRLRVLNVTPELGPEEIGAAARRARTHGEWLILMFHHLPERANGPLDYPAAAFREALAAIARSGIRVLPVSRVWHGLAAGGTAGASLPAAAP